MFNKILLAVLAMLACAITFTSVLYLAERWGKVSLDVKAFGIVGFTFVNAFIWFLLIWIYKDTKGE